MHPADAIVDTWNRTPITIAELVAKPGTVLRSMDDEDQLIPNIPQYVIHGGESRVLRITTLSGRRLRCAPECQVQTKQGWMRAGDLTAVKNHPSSGSKLATAPRMLYDLVVFIEEEPVQPVFQIQMKLHGNYLASDLIMKECC